MKITHKGSQKLEKNRYYLSVHKVTRETSVIILTDDKVVYISEHGLEESSYEYFYCEYEIIKEIEELIVV